MSQRLARSNTFFTHAERVSLALVAARSYLDFRSSLTRIVRYSRSPFSTGGLPSFFMALIMYQRIILDKMYLLLVHLRYETRTNQQNLRDLRQEHGSAHRNATSAKASRPKWRIRTPPLLRHSAWGEAS